MESKVTPKTVRLCPKGNGKPLSGKQTALMKDRNMPFTRVKVKTTLVDHVDNSYIKELRQALIYGFSPSNQRELWIKMTSSQSNGWNSLNIIHCPESA